MTPWAAPAADGPIAAEVLVPGSKSATARALVLSALAAGPGSIRGGLRARDSDLMIAGLRGLGAVIDDSSDRWRIEPVEPAANRADIDCGLAGTVMRFLPAVAALGRATACFHGDPAASGRPMGPLVAGLRQLGAVVTADGLPLCVTGPATGRRAVIDSSASSQFISALLLAAPRLPDGLALAHEGPPVPSLPHIDMTVAALARRGVAVNRQATTWEVAPGPVAALDEVIEPDLTTAAVFLAAALVTGGRVAVPAWPAGSAQPGAQAVDILASMGAVVEAGPPLALRGTGEILGADLDLHEVSELTPVVAALAVLADGPSVIRGVAHIRGHETNRLAALAAELTALGADCRETADGLAIRPRPLTGGLFHTYADHRMAHAGALIGLRVPGVGLDDVACTGKTMPGFVAAWEAMLR